MFPLTQGAQFYQSIPHFLPHVIFNFHEFFHGFMGTNIGIIWLILVDVYKHFNILNAQPRVSKVHAYTCNVENPFSFIMTVHNRAQLWLEYTKGMSRPKIIPRTLLQMTTMLTNSFILVNLVFQYILTFFMIEMVVIICDLDDLNMSLNVLEHISRMLSHYAILLKKN